MTVAANPLLIVGGFRSNAPNSWPWLAPGMSWHHVIPHSVLKCVWNGLATAFIETDLAEARTAIRHFLLLGQPRLTEVDTLLDRARLFYHARPQSQPAAHLQPLETHEITRLREAAEWPAWNAVQGPPKEARLDDPGDDWLDRFQAGLTPPERQQMRWAESLYPVLVNAASSSPLPTTPALVALIQALSQARPFLRDAAPIEFRPAMWEQDAATGKWRKARPE